MAEVLKYLEHEQWNVDCIDKLDVVKGKQFKIVDGGTVLSEMENGLKVIL